MQIAWKDNLLMVGVISEQGIAFDFNPGIYEKIVARGEALELGRAIVNLGLAIRDGRVKKIDAPLICGPDGAPLWKT